MDHAEAMEAISESIEIAKVIDIISNNRVDSLIEKARVSRGGEGLEKIKSKNEILNF